QVKNMQVIGFLLCLFGMLVNRSAHSLDTSMELTGNSEQVQQTPPTTADHLSFLINLVPYVLKNVGRLDDNLLFLMKNFIKYIFHYVIEFLST
ncbi:hypothetical protein, partial [Nocardioides abyssi]